MPPIISDIVRKLVDAASTTDIAEVDVRLNGLHITVRRSPKPAAAPGPTSPHNSSTDNLIHVTAPIVGTFRTAAAEGTRLKRGDAVGRVEALGLSIDIPAPTPGYLLRILVENGEPVEYGQILCTILPSGGQP